MLHGCINTRKSKARFKNLLILLDSGYSSNILMVRLVPKLIPKKGCAAMEHKS